MLMKKPVFKNLETAMSVLGSMALSIYSKGEVVQEYTCRIEEFRVNEDGHAFSLIVLWGFADYFFIHDKDPEEVTVIDGAYNSGSTDDRICDELLYLIKRCMLVGYVPYTLLKAVHESGRASTFKEFEKTFHETIECVCDILETFEQ